MNRSGEVGGEGDSTPVSGGKAKGLPGRPQPHPKPLPGGDHA